jgi:lipoprotein signal peptidase
MPGVIRSTGVRVLLAIALYVLVVVLAAIVFQSTRKAPESGPHLHYMVYGVALSLFTHMGYVLFLLQSFLLVPWLLWAIFRPRMRAPVITGFCVTWLIIGWRMHDLF